MLTENYGAIDLEFWTSSKVLAKVSINPQDNHGWTVQDMANLIALLELQRSMLADEKLDVSVSVATPRLKNRQTEPMLPHNHADGASEILAKSAQ